MIRIATASLSVIALMTAAAAAAQDGAPSAGGSGPESSSKADAPAAIGDIIVTASRRAENVQKSALSIQALSSEVLARANIKQPEDLAGVAAGVNIGTGGNYPQVYIRGVGNYGTQSYSEGAVAFNLDGVYISRSWATRGMLYDLDRVEVLKGPQGTLYGRNASGGAINVITAKPKFDAIGGFAELQAGNYDLIQGTAAINIPLSSTLAVRASGQVVSRDGYLTNGYNDDKTQAARLQMLWKPSDTFSLLLNGNYQHLGGKGAGSVLTPQLPGNRWRGASDPAVVAIIRAQPGLGPLLVVPKNDGFLNIDVYAIGAEMNWDLGFATLTVLPAYREAHLRDRNYVPGFSAENNEDDKQTSVEVRLGHDSERLKWVLGAYYFDESQENAPGKGVQVVRQGIQAQNTTPFEHQIRSYALFGQATFSLTERLRVTGGLRYTHERKTLQGLLNSFSLASGTPPGCAAGFVFDTNTISPPLFCRLDVPLGGRLTYNNITYKAGLEFDLAPRSMAFANISSGFKSGGFFTSPPPNTFRPEKLTAVEVGVKNRFLDNRLQLNIEGFYWRYKDHQESHIGPTSNPNFFAFITENAGRAESYGADFDVLFHPTSQDELNLKVQYNKTKYNTFIYSNFTARFGPPVTGCVVGPLVGPTQAVDCSGKQLVRSPTWSGTAGYSHTFDLGSAGSLTASADVQFSSSYYLSIDFLEAARQDAYAVGNFNLSWKSDGGRWMVSAFVQNVTNKAVLQQATRYPFVSRANPLASPDGFILATIRQPRTFGGRVRVTI